MECTGLHKPPTPLLPIKPVLRDWKEGPKIVSLICLIGAGSS